MHDLNCFGSVFTLRKFSASHLSVTTKVLSSATILLGSHPICFCLQIRRTGRGIGLHNKATIFVSTKKRTIERIFGLHRAHFRYQVSCSFDIKSVVVVVVVPNCFELRRISLQKILVRSWSPYTFAQKRC